ncbi:hypothetical protein KC338_g308 [Hortaea werneckii]|nr:hypothetical protein KC338_g308 [Hortaea werneckii]
MLIKHTRSPLLQANRTLTHSFHNWTGFGRFPGPALHVATILPPHPDDTGSHQLLDLAADTSVLHVLLQCLQIKRLAILEKSNFTAWELETYLWIALGLLQNALHDRVLQDGHDVRVALDTLLSLLVGLALARLILRLKCLLALSFNLTGVLALLVVGHGFAADVNTLVELLHGVECLGLPQVCTDEVGLTRELSIESRRPVCILELLVAELAGLLCFLRVDVGVLLGRNLRLFCSAQLGQNVWSTVIHLLVCGSHTAERLGDQLEVGKHLATVLNSLLAILQTCLVVALFEICGRAVCEHAVPSAFSLSASSFAFFFAMLSSSSGSGSGSGSGALFGSSFGLESGMGTSSSFLRGHQQGHQPLPRRQWLAVQTPAQTLLERCSGLAAVRAQKRPRRSRVRLELGRLVRIFEGLVELLERGIGARSVGVKDVVRRLGFDRLAKFLCSAFEVFGCEQLVAFRLECVGHDCSGLWKQSDDVRFVFAVQLEHNHSIENRPHTDFVLLIGLVGGIKTLRIITWNRRQRHSRAAVLVLSRRYDRKNFKNAFVKIKVFLGCYRRLDLMIHARAAKCAFKDHLSVLPKRHYGAGEQYKHSREQHPNDLDVD